MLLPTTIGTFDLDKDVGKPFGAFPEEYLNCGKTPTVVKKLGVDEDKMSLDVIVDCSPHPMRVVINKETAPGKKFKFQNGDLVLNTCIGLQTCHSHPVLNKVNLGDAVVDATQTQPINTNPAEDDICQNGNTKPEEILFSNEFGCKNPTEVPDVTAATGNAFIVPRWKTNGDNLFHVMRAFTQTGLGRKLEPKVIPRTNNFVNLPKRDKLMAENSWAPCNGGCDKGDVIKFTMKEASWKTVIYLKGQTKGFKICIDGENHDIDNTPPGCRSRFEMFILPRNGLVIWPKNRRASPIELKPKSIDDGNVYAIEVGYGVKSENGGKPRGEFYVANMFREVVVSDSDEYDARSASKVSFFFETDSDLAENAGIVSRQIDYGKTFINKARVSEVTVRQVLDPKDGFAVTGGGESLVNQPDDPPQSITVTTTAAPKRLSSNALLGARLVATDNTSDGIYTRGKWWTWGLYIGFVSGSIIAVAIISGIFYGLRRTVYGFWYRGMYKRYGCDASGTTGGVTGVGFGNTTTGAITVGGTTGKTGMTTGKTGGTTTGGTTTGGGTTGSMTSTGGASTIAM